MPNVLNPEAARALAARAARKVTSPEIAARLERLLFVEALNDPTCLRLANGDELGAAPDWTRAALARGEHVHVFTLSRRASARAHGVARRVELTCKLAQSMDDQPSVSTIILARAFLRTIARADFETIERKSRYFARAYKSVDYDTDEKTHCAARAIVCANGRVWRRIISIAQLREAGRAFDNCLARSTHGSTYGRRLRRGSAQYWALYDLDGAPLVVAMAPAPLAEWFNEVRGPRNARIPHDDPDLLRLASAIGIISGDPPPPAAAAIIPLSAPMPFPLSRCAA